MAVKNTLKRLTLPFILGGLFFGALGASAPLNNKAALNSANVVTNKHEVKHDHRAATKHEVYLRDEEGLFPVSDYERLEKFGGIKFKKGVLTFKYGCYYEGDIVVKPENGEKADLKIELKTDLNLSAYKITNENGNIELYSQVYHYFMVGYVDVNGTLTVSGDAFLDVIGFGEMQTAPATVSSLLKAKRFEIIKAADFTCSDPSFTLLSDKKMSITSLINVDELYVATYGIIDLGFENTLPEDAAATILNINSNGSFNLEYSSSFMLYTNDNNNTSKFINDTVYLTGYETTYFENRLQIEKDLGTINIRYHQNGGLGQMDVDTKKAGYTYFEECFFYHTEEKEFVGWAIGSPDARPLYKPYDNVLLFEDTDVYAVWDPDNIYVYLDPNGAPFGEVEEYRGFNVGDVYNLSIPEYSGPNGEEFVGWAADDPASRPLIGPYDNFTLEKTMTFYAVWNEDDFKVTLNSNNIHDAEIYINRSFEYGDLYELPECDFEELDMKFTGWLINDVTSNELYLPGTEIEVLSDTTIYAYWTKDGEVEPGGPQIIDGETGEPIAPDVEPENEPVQLNALAIVGIILGSLIVLGGLAFLIYYLLKKKKEENKEENIEQPKE